MKYKVEYDPDNLDIDSVCNVLHAIEHYVAEFEDVGLDTYMFRHGNVHVTLRKGKTAITIKLKGDDDEHDNSKE